MHIYAYSSGTARISVRGEHFSGVGLVGLFKEFLKKTAKMLYFSIFFKKLTNHALNFRAFGRKTHCWKI